MLGKTEEEETKFRISYKYTRVSFYLSYFFYDVTDASTEAVISEYTYKWRYNFEIVGLL